MPRKKQIDIIDQRFGALLVINETGPGRNYDRLFLCRCDCGNEKICSMNELRKGRLKSCGCSNKERLKKMQEKNELTRVDGIQPMWLTRKTPENKSTGIRGVTAEYTKKGKKIYRAYISIGGKKHNLGTFYSLIDASKARKEAEEKYYKPILEKAQLLNKKQNE